MADSNERRTLWSSLFGPRESNQASANSQDEGKSSDLPAEGGVLLADAPTLDLASLEEQFDIVSVHDEPGMQFAVVATKGDMSTELGSTSPSPWTSWRREEYNEELRGQKGYDKYDRMRKSDATVRGTLRATKTPVLAASFFMQAGGDSTADENAAEFIWKCFTEYMSISWTQVLIESLLMLDFGNYMLEKVFEQRTIDGKRRDVLKKLAPRHPMDIDEWVLDANGGPVGVWFYASADDLKERRDNLDIGDLNAPRDPDLPLPQSVSGIPNLDLEKHPSSVFIPIEKLLVFTFDKEGSNIEGVSVLRSAYKHWFYKEQLYKIDAIQKERHGIGIPVIKLPMGYKNADKLAAEKLGRNIRTNERAHIVLPPGWEVHMLKLEGNPVDAMKSIEHHNASIRENVLANFIGGSRSTAGGQKQDVDIFLKAVRFIADIFVDTFNMYCIPQLIEYNFSRVKYPKLRYRHIGEPTDLRTLSFALRNMIGAGVIEPDDDLEANMREALGLPKKDKETVRKVAKPQGGPQGGGGPNQPGPPNQPNPPGQPKPPRVGPPRQAPVGKQKNVTGTPAPNAGKDASGGK